MNQSRTEPHDRGGETLLGRFSGAVEKALGLAFGPAHRTHLEEGLTRLRDVLGTLSPEECVSWLEHGQLGLREQEMLASCLTVSETYFFRESAVLDALEAGALREVIVNRRRSGDRRLRIWSAGCSSGEEPYTLAIRLAHLIPRHEEWDITLLATDINPEAIARAERAVYRAWSFRSAPAWVRPACFKQTTDGEFALRKEYRSMVTFAHLNLVADPYPALTNNTHAMDLILCRNVLMYFRQDCAGRVLERLSRSLVDGGILVVGQTELSMVQELALTAVRRPGSTWFKKVGQRTTPEVMPPAAPNFATRYEIAPERLEKTKEREPGREVLEDVARLFAAGSSADAASLAEHALANDEYANGTRAELMEYACRCHANQGNAQRAAEWSQRLIGHHPDRASYRFLDGLLRQERGDKQQAVARFREALFLDPEFLLAHFVLGNLARGTGRTEEAQRHFRNAENLLEHMDDESIIPYSEGVTAGRMRELVGAVRRRR